MDLLEKFGKKIRITRENKNLSQEDLAFKSGLSVYYISRIERGKANVSLETIAKLQKALGIILLSI